MKKLMVLLILLTLGLFGCVETNEPTHPDQVNRLSEEQLNSTYIDWYGRHIYQQDRMYFYHTATGLKVRFYGRVLRISFHLEMKRHDIYYSVSKDGSDLLTEEPFIQKNADDVYEISFESYGLHTVELVKRSEPEDGITSITQLETNGYFVEKEVIERPHFLIIGASGISGHGALGTEGKPRTTANSSSLHSFGFLTAQAFDGTYEFVANSGWGLAFGFNDTSGEVNIQKAYEDIGIDSSQHLIGIPYTHEVIPDYIIVNIGGNDYSAVINKLSGFDKTEKIQEFKESVGNFILKLRQDAPEAHIFWTMTEGSLNGTAASQVIAQLSLEDQTYVHVIVIKQVGEDGDPEGANNHASYITHQKSAQIIIDAIEEINRQSQN